MEESKKIQERVNEKNLCLIFTWNPKKSRWTAEEYKEACLKVKNGEKYLISRRRTKRNYRTRSYKKSSR